MEPIELTDPEAFRESLAGGGVLTVTRGTFETPIAHSAGCAQLRQGRLPSKRGHRYWWTPDYATAVAILGARKCEHCLRPRKHRTPFLPRP